MDDLNQTQSKRIKRRLGRHLSLVMLVALVALPAKAEFPELLPSYAKSVAMREDASLQAVDFVNSSLGVAVGDRGVILRTEDGGQSWQKAESNLQCRLDDVHWINDRSVVAVGGHYDRITGLSRGVALVSRNAGRTWQRAEDSELPRLRKLSIRAQDKVLVAIGDWEASSLSREFESRDQGQTWVSSGELDGPAVLPAEPTAVDFAKWTAATKVNAPIRDACRVGDAGLCAVCDHGIILNSIDGGETWQVARGQKRRAAVLVIASQPETVAWPLIGNESLELRNRVSVLIVDAKRSPDPSLGSEIDLVRQAAVMLGAAGVDQLTATHSRQPDQPKQSISQAVSQWIAIHRPSVIVVDQTLPKSVQTMISQTAVGSRTPRVVRYSFTGRGESMLHSGAMMPNTGVLARDMWQDAMQLVAPNLPIQKSVSLRRAYDASGNTQRGESVAAGLQLASGQKIKAKLPTASRRQLQIIQARLAHPQRIDDLIASDQSGDQFRRSIGGMLDQTAAEDRFRLAWSILLRIESQATNAEFQSALLNEIADRFGDSSAGKWARLRIDSMTHSLEWSKLKQSINDVVQTKSTVKPLAEIVPVSPFQTNASRVVQASAVAPVQVARPRTVTRRVSNKESTIDLNWEFNPLVLFARAAARNRGDDNELKKTGEGSANLRRLLDDQHSRTWANLLSNNGPSTVIARATTTPPRLDGIVDDTCWQAALPAAGRTPLQIAYDEDYIYVAMQCLANRLRSDDYVRSKASPIRDHDLTGVDRLVLAIDSDQDLLTSMQFSVTDTGRTHDAIDHHDAWNPTWYIATDRTNTIVSFEFAIRRRDISELPIVPGQNWFVSSQIVAAGDRNKNVLPKVENWLRVVFK